MSEYMTESSLGALVATHTVTPCYGALQINVILLLLLLLLFHSTAERSRWHAC